MPVSCPGGQCWCISQSPETGQTWLPLATASCTYGSTELALIQVLHFWNFVAWLYAVLYWPYSSTNLFTGHGIEAEVIALIDDQKILPPLYVMGKWLQRIQYFSDPLWVSTYWSSIWAHTQLNFNLEWILVFHRDEFTASVVNGWHKNPPHTWHMYLIISCPNRMDIFSWRWLGMQCTWFTACVAAPTDG